MSEQKTGQPEQVEAATAAEDPTNDSEVASAPPTPSNDQKKTNPDRRDDETADAGRLRHDSGLPSFIAVTGFLAITLSLGGLANQWMILHRFDVSLADYADLDDFLVAAVNLFSPLGIKVVWFYLFGAAVLFLTAAIVERRRERSGVTEEPLLSHRDILGVLGFVLIIVVLYLGGTTGKETANRIKYPPPGRDSLLSCVDIQLKLPGPALKRHSPVPNAGSATSESTLYFITGLNAALFVYEVGEHQAGESRTGVVHAIPTSAIAQVTYVDCPKRR